ncbi:nucleoside hydrolase [Rhodonellum psychrophilum GCM71 = DSM 17998]|uniref:Nucleoside hydrolase n=2 Tax=Rhodonellum TaxID=336827 RepID=U5C565_9BACT|nr:MULTISPECIES: nucleoside hydrolase [Rhodonellum]ERM83327.1 nucleoside hydrolase [Rhodonellum psychrophilum GCM71 = DSM 17998]SDZ38770.1 Inosine-uridine preferring nucleoside hydrolase [Rhodonellum ikkaensis]
MKTFITFIIAFFISLPSFSQKQKVWLDSDTGNEMDDLYAIVRLLKTPDVEVVGLSSAHFNNPDLLVFEKWNAYDTKGFNSVKESQRLNELILQTMGLTNIPHPIGADRQIGRAWGGQEPRDSPAARGIIESVKSLPEGEKLDILLLGALTNVASAILLSPDILPKIRVYCLGANYNQTTRAWSKNEFNIRNDLNAFDYLLDLKDLDLIIMPLETSRPLQFDRDVSYEKTDDAVPIEKILADRWREQNPQDKTRVMWDLALVQAYLLPQHSEILMVNSPPENKTFTVKIYSKIDKEAMENDFWEVLKRK